MEMFSAWKAFLRRLTCRSEEAELDEELAFHLERQTRENITQGMGAPEARRQARIAFGAIERTRDECRESRPGFWIDRFLQDVRYALRGYRRNPMFTLTIVITLMLGIGTTAAVFSVVDRILFRSLPYVDADRLVSVGLVAPIEPQEFMLGGSYYEWRDHQKPFETFTSEIGVTPCDLAEDQPVRLSCAGVEANFLPTLGFNPILGRNFSAKEDRPNAPKVGLISYQFWKDRFGGDAGILEKLINIDGQPVRVIGVLPQKFQMPRLQAVDVVVPEALDELQQRRADPGRPMWAFARLKNGVTIEQAKQELQPLFDYSLRLAPAAFRKEVHLQVRSLRDRQMHDVRITAWILFGLVIVVLLIACANVASLLIARSLQREKEFAIRSALGANRSRLVHQALVESLFLSLSGAAVGCFFASFLLKLFVAIAPEGVPFLNKPQIDTRILLFTLFCALFCGVLFGLLSILRKPYGSMLTERTVMNSSTAALRQWLVGAQITASIILLVGGTLLFRSFLKLQDQNLGMCAENVVTVSLSLGQKAYSTADRRMIFFQQLQRELRYGPGISTLAISDSLPPGGYHHDQIYASIQIDNRPKPSSGTGGLVAWRWVTPEYFRVLDIPIIQGEGFREDELTSTDHFVVLGKTLADRMFPEQSPIGHRLRLAGSMPENNPWYTVVGVAGNVKNGGLAGEDEPEYYRLRRTVAEDWDRSSIVVLKTTLPSEMIERWVHARVIVLDPIVPIHIETLSERVHKMASPQRFETLLVGFFAVTGLTMAAIGLYGVVSFLVTQREREIGVRLALGATRRNILQLVMGRSLRLIAWGTLMGLAASLMVSRILSHLLFSIGPYDPLSYGLVVLLLVFVGLMATIIPARSAIRVDPAVTLRSE